MLGKIKKQETEILEADHVIETLCSGDIIEQFGADVQGGNDVAYPNLENKP